MPERCSSEACALTCYALLAPVSAWQCPVVGRYWSPTQKFRKHPAISLAPSEPLCSPSHPNRVTEVVSYVADGKLLSPLS